MLKHSTTCVNSGSVNHQRPTSCTCHQREIYTHAPAGTLFPLPLGNIKHLMMMMMRHRHTAAVPLASSLLLCSFRLNVFSVLSYCYVCQTADCSIHTRPTERQSGLTSHMTFVCVALPPLDHQVYVDDERHLTETDRAAIQTPPTTPHVRLFYMGGPGP